MSTEIENHGVTKQMARFVVMYDTPSDIEAFERHYLVAMLDWDDMESLGAALGSEAGDRTAEDAITKPIALPWAPQPKQ